MGKETQYKKCLKCGKILIANQNGKFNHEGCIKNKKNEIK